MQWANQNSNQLHVADVTRGKTRANESWSAWFYFWLVEKITRVLSQSCSAVDAKPITFPHSSENRSIYRLLVVLFVCLFQDCTVKDFSLRCFLPPCHFVLIIGFVFQERVYNGYEWMALIFCHAFSQNTWSLWRLEMLSFTCNAGQLLLSAIFSSVGFFSCMKLNNRIGNRYIIRKYVWYFLHLLRGL